MPHKRNPVACERISGLSRILRANAQAAFENIALWHERDISHSSVERIIFPDSTIVLDYLLDKTANLVDRLVVYPDRMQDNLNMMHGLVFSGQLLLELVERGITREDAYRWVQRNAMKVWDDGVGFKDGVLADPDITSAMEASDIEKVFESAKLLENVDRIFERVFGTAEAR